MVYLYSECQRGWAKLPEWKHPQLPQQFSESSDGLNNSDKSFYDHLLSFDSKLRKFLVDEEPKQRHLESSRSHRLHRFLFLVVLPLN